MVLRVRNMHKQTISDRLPVLTEWPVLGEQSARVEQEARRRAKQQRAALADAIMPHD
jgi:hypothetical protein